MTQQEDDRVDWWEVIQSLKRAGVGIKEQAMAIGACKTAILNLRNLDAEPRYIRGDRLLRLFRDRCPDREVPRQRARTVYRVLPD